MLITAYVALGGNLGPVLQTFARALAMMPRHGLHVSKVSSAVRTVALKRDSDTDNSAPDYWNCVCQIDTTLSAEAVLAVLLEIEAQCGRERRERWASRTLDLDLLLYGNSQIATESLTVPHPALGKRLFVLAPLSEIAADYWVPGENKTVRQLLEELPRVEGDISEMGNII